MREVKGEKYSPRTEIENSRGIEKKEEVLEKILRRYEGCETRTKRSEGRSKRKRLDHGGEEKKAGSVSCWEHFSSVCEVLGVF